MKLSCWQVVQYILIISVFIVAQEQQVEINDYYAKVYLAPTTTSRFIGLAQKGESYTVLETRDSWLRIRFKNAVGWIQISQISSDQQPQTASKTDTPKTTAATQSNNASPSRQDDSNISESATKSDQKKISSEKPQTVSQKSSSSTSNKSSQSEDNSISQQKRDAKLRNWINQQNISNNLPTTQQLEELEIKYFQVILAPAVVHSALNPEAPILGMAKKGDLLPLIGEGDSWCKVMYADTMGWIERRVGKVIDKPKSLFFTDFLFIGGIVLVLALLIIVLLVILSIFRKNKNQTKDISIQKNVLIIAKTSKTIQYTLTDTSTSLERCFSEIGFNIVTAKDHATINSTIDKIPIDILIIDWKFDRNVLSIVERSIIKNPGAKNIFCIVYNTADPSTMKPDSVLPNTFFLGQTFSDRDIFKLITPLLVSENSKNTQKGNQSSALEGNIADGNLLEVLQFIEIGSKTGCLLIETDRPFGLIYFLNGRIIYAATAQEIVGRDAIFKALNLKEGNFRFILNRKPKSSNVNLSTLEILMEWTKTIDEAHGH